MKTLLFVLAVVGVLAGFGGWCMCAIASKRTPKPPQRDRWYTDKGY